ncbi:MAG: OmpA family protein [Thiohalocapsa sp.]|uniref:OmpA family protein n=1 Tax=Thiohalocapsa sp. TaxID=2497641 RepID=UPI0025DE0B92|nr:OmpA family protein [Thiohalocapsa sp.]MCG6940096.1 OmpA family protein [Thiohalocapsa sp.]
MYSRRSRATRFGAASLALLAATAIALAGCATDEFGNRRPLTETEAGVAIGSAAGAAAGALLGSRSADAGKGALIGVVGGAIAGGLVGNYMERQRRDFERVLADEIARGDIRVEALPEDRLLVSMTSSTAFDVDSTTIKPGFYSTLDKISAVVNKYGKTRLDIAGHTDNTGSEAYNQDLSERRAAAVQSYLLADQVIPQRLTSEGYGELRPVATNDTEYGRTLNRRVDITITPIVSQTS